MGYDFDGVTVSNGVELVGGGEFELAFKEHGAVVYVVDGDEDNFKITTPADLERFKQIVAGRMSEER